MQDVNLHMTGTLDQRTELAIALFPAVCASFDSTHEKGEFLEWETIVGGSYIVADYFIENSKSTLDKTPPVDYNV